MFIRLLISGDQHIRQTYFLLLYKQMSEKSILLEVGGLHVSARVFFMGLFGGSTILEKLYVLNNMINVLRFMG